jgi:hypothetical protein
MRRIRKADFFYPGFELAGVETCADRMLTRTFCLVARVGAAAFDALSAPNAPRQSRSAAGFEG